MHFIRSTSWTRVVIVGVALALFPVTAHWIWGGGWISQRGFYDFAGGATVHFSVGLVALMGALLAGPRTGRIWGDAPGSLIGTLLMGTGLVMFGLAAYNPAGMLNLLQAEGRSGTLLINGLSAGAAGAITAALLTTLRRENWTYRDALRGMFAGLAAVSAGWIWMNVLGAVVAGALAGFALVLVSQLLEVLHVDDWLDVIAVHGAGGAVGVLSAGLFLDRGLTGEVSGVLMGGGMAALSNQFIGLIAVGLFVGIISASLLWAIRSAGYLRTTIRPRVMLFEEFELEASDRPT